MKKESHSISSIKDVDIEEASIQQNKSSREEENIDDEMKASNSEMSDDNSEKEKNKGDIKIVKKHTSIG